MNKHLLSLISPFKLTATESLKINKKKPISLGGQWGNREELINKLVLEMI